MRSYGSARNYFLHLLIIWGAVLICLILLTAGSHKRHHPDHAKTQTTLGR